MPRVDLKQVLLDEGPPDSNAGELYDSIVAHSRFFVEGIVFSIMDGGTIIMVCLSCLATLLCAKGFLNLEWDASMSIVAIGSIFPLVFSIQASYQGREAVVRMIGGFKANLFSIFFTFQSWLDQNELSSADVEDDMNQLVCDVLIYLRSKQVGPGEEGSVPELAHNVYDGFRRIFRHVEAAKLLPKPPTPPEISTQANFIRFAMVNFEEARCTADYRTPRGLRLFCFVVIHVSPIFLAPYFNRYCKNQNDSSAESHMYGCQSGYFMSILFVLINSTLLKVQQQLENPFDGDGDDDIKWGIWTDQLSQMSNYGANGPALREKNVLHVDKDDVPTLISGPQGGTYQRI
jgi:hypothetical protein